VNPGSANQGGGTAPQDPPQLASPDQLPAMDRSAKESGTTNEVGKGTVACTKKSWFAIRVVHQPAPDQAEQTVDGLTLNLKLSCSGPATEVTSKGTDTNKIPGLSPGGTGDVESTDHSESVWEVETDIT
jgi:hypothetical protein